MTTNFSCVLARAVLLAAGLCVFGVLPARAQFAPLKHSAAYDNFDLRDTAAAATPTAPLATYRARQATTARADALATMKRGMATERAALVARVPGLRVENNRFGTLPEAVDSARDKEFLTPASARPAEENLRAFLSEHAALYGLTAAETAGLVKTIDEANPAGNMSWVGMRQQINGLPVFQGEIVAGFTPAGALVRTTGNLAAGLDAASLSATPAMTAAQAVAAASSAIGRTVAATGLTLMSTGNAGRTSTLVGGPYSRATQTDLTYFSTEPGVATLAYAMVLWDQPRAYYILVDAADGTLLFRKCITDDQTQSVKYNVYTGDSPSPLSPTTVLPGQGTQPPAVSRTDVTLVADDLTASPLGWITDSAAGATVATTGNNCDAGLDAASPDGIDVSTSTITYLPRPTTTNRTFSFSYNPPPGNPAGSTQDQATNYTAVTSNNVTTNTLTTYAAGVVTNLFFWTNRYHDRLYNLGFTEPFHNFQTTNTFTISNTTTNRGGTAGDAVSAQVHDYSGTDNANFSTPPDGNPGIMQMYLFNDVSTLDRDGSLDGDVFLHEMTHGLSNRLHSNGSGLAINQSRGMGEGWSDFYARGILASADENVDGVYASGGYVTYKLGGSFTDNYYYGIRRFPYAVISILGSNGKPHNPETFADVDPTQISLADGAYSPNPLFGTGSAVEVHNIGEVWCSMLLEVRERYIKRLGFADTGSGSTLVQGGNNRALQIVTDAMKLDVASPNMVQARDSVIAAAKAYDTAKGITDGADVLDARKGFAARGMGAGATTDGTAVVETFAPDVGPGSVTFSDAPGNGNGVAEPGEDLVITVPLTNVGTIAETATASIGIYTASYNLAANGGSVTQAIPFRVPASAVPGSTVTVPITYTGLYGTYIYNYLKLLVGSPVYDATFTQTFDGVTAPSLPTGWTTDTETATGGVTGTAWKTVTTVVDSGNSVYTPDLNGSSTDNGATGAGGGASLYSPAVTLPTTGTPQLTFKHTYNTEAGYDGGVLEISVAGGAYTDIVSAGGSFAQNGYNATINKNYGNPIKGRSAWSGAATKVVVVVNLPASALGKSVTFRWRLGFDNYYTPTGGGWNVDTVKLVKSYAVAPIDSDGDGLQNGYETAHGLNPNDATDAAKDSDGDGQTNLQEYLAGTDPQSASSALKVSQSTYNTSGQLSLTFPTVMGRVYSYEYKNALTDTAWTPSGASYNGTGGDVTIIFSPTDLGGQTARFYRVTAQLP